MTISALFQTLLQNQVVTGLSVTALLGGAAYQLRSLPHLCRQGLLRFFTVELTVISSDPSFEWIERWLAQQPYSKKSRMIRLQALSKNEYYNQYHSETEWSLAPGRGLHVFRWRNRPVLLERDFLSKETVEDGRARSSKPLEQLHFRTIGWSQRTIRRLIEEARQLSTQDDLVAVRIWVDYRWLQVRGKSQRPLETIILKAGQFDRIVNDLHWFMGAQDWYLARGIPYRRGYCFAGHPGCGKTSVVLALAGYLGRPICVINLGSIESDNALFEAFREAPINALILIEDIDCAFSAHDRTAERDKSEQDDARGVSKAGLLNALDGITTPDGRIFVMTTNFPERLDAALVRPGRADVHERFDYFGPAEQVCMAQRFFDEFEPLPFPVSPAEMQAAFMQHPDDAQAARAQLLSSAHQVAGAQPDEQEHEGQPDRHS